MAATGKWTAAGIERAACTGGTVHPGKTNDMTPIGQSGHDAHRTIGSVLAAQTAALGHQPLLTFYDDRSGERTELSYATYFNWASKAANLLAEELDLARGGSVTVGVTGHWTGAVVTVAAWMVGASVAFGMSAGKTDVLVVSEAGAPGHAAHPGLLVIGGGMGGRLTTAAPGVAFGDEVLAFGDDYDDPHVSGELAAVDVAGKTVSQIDLLHTAADVLPSGARALVTSGLGSLAGILEVLVMPIAAGGSVVWCPASAGERLAERRAQERVTHVLRDGFAQPA